MILKKKPVSEQGFTLIELLIVIIIIGILAAVAIPAFLNQRKHANDAVVKSDVRNVALAVETLITDNPRGPITKSSDGKSLVSGSLTEPVVNSKGVHWDIYGSQNGYCIIGWHDNGKLFTSFSSPLSYDSNAGGMRPISQGCGSISAAPDGTVISPPVGSSTPTSYAWTGTPNASSSTAAYTDGTTRNNLATNPSVETNTNNWSTFIDNGAAVSSRQVSGGVSGSSFYRAAWTTSPTTAQGGITYGLQGINPGDIYSSSTSIRTNNSQRIKVGFKWYDSTNSRILTDDDTGTILVGNTWTTMSHSGTAPANAVELRITFYATTGTGGRLWVAGDTLDADAMIIEKSSTVSTYFDGSTPVIP